MRSVSDVFSHRGGEQLGWPYLKSRMASDLKVCMMILKPTIAMSQSQKYAKVD